MLLRFPGNNVSGFLRFAFMDRILKYASFGTLALLLCVLVVATFVEKLYGTEAVMACVYGSSWFVAIWIFLVVVSLAYLLFMRLFRRRVVFLLHISFVIIAAGALLTHIYGIRGMVHLREGAPPTSVFYHNDDSRIGRFPFQLSLDDFLLLNYSGTLAPMDYVSRITVRDDNCEYKAGIAMNSIAKYKGWRFYQSGYDADECGTTLLVSYDPMGIGVTYSGYAMLLFSFVLFFFQRKSGFYLLLKRLSRLRTFLLLLFALVSLPVAAGNNMPIANFAEELYNGIDFMRPVAVLCIMMGVTLFGVSCRNMITGRGGHSFIYVLSLVVLFAVLSYLLFFISLRWYIGGYIPLSNGYETMLFMACSSLVITLFFHRRFLFMLPFGLLLCGLALMVTTMGGSNPRITNLIPVLRSPLLSLHVTVIMVAYSLFAFMMFNGLAALFLHKNRRVVEYLAIVSRLMLYPAVFLLITGVFIGAVWANISWGRYWGWDPKEVWALITMFVYSVPFHSVSFPVLRSSMAFHVYAVVAFLTVLMTYFGVNYILGGIHSYA